MLANRQWLTGLIEAENRVEAEVNNVLSKLDAAQKRVTMSCQQHHTAKHFKESERTCFELGKTFCCLSISVKSLQVMLC